MFRHLADQEFRGSSPRYERLARLCAERPELAAPLLAAPVEHRRATLFFAAVQYLLRTVVPGHPLAAYLPTLGGRRPVDGGLERAFADLAAAHVDELNEASAGGAELFLAERPAEAGPLGVLAVGLLTLASWRAGRARVEVLARTGPHGQWSAWGRRRYDFAPAHTRSTA